MSATIVWQPKESKRLGVGFPSSFIEVMGKAFGKFPLDLTRQDIDKLSGMAAMCREDDNPYQKLVDILREEHDAIRVWAEY